VVEHFSTVFIELVLGIVFAQANNCRPWDRIKVEQMLNKPEKQLAPGCARTAIEPEREFVQIIVQAASSNGSLVCAKQPSFKQRGNEMRKGKLLRIFAYLMSIAFNREATVALPTISDNRAARHNRIFDEGFQGNRRQSSWEENRVSNSDRDLG